jgi:hypothetical protein
MSEIALARINSFAHVAQQAEVSPEESVFVLSSRQLHEIISRAVLEATEPLKAELQELRDIELQDMRTLSHDIQDAFEAIQEIDQRQQIKPQPLQKDRGEILRALLAANDGKMLRSHARKKMRLSESRFSELLATMDDYIEVRPYHLNKNWKVLVLK